MATKNILDTIASEIDYIESRIEQWRERLGKKADEAHEEMLHEIEERTAGLRELFEDAKNAGEEAFYEISDRFEDGISEIKELFQDLERRSKL